jgi:hypothetical protein
VSIVGHVGRRGVVCPEAMGLVAGCLGDLVVRVFLFGAFMHCCADRQEECMILVDLFIIFLEYTGVLSRYLP